MESDFLGEFGKVSFLRNFSGAEDHRNDDKLRKERMFGKD